MTRRAAYSLIELLIVLAIIVAVTSVGVLSLRAMQAPYKLTGAVDSVRAAWALARSYAAEEDRPYRFSVEPNGRHFRVAPDAEGGEKGFTHTDALPPGVRFSADGSAPPPGPASEADTPPGGQWETACVFQPDGTCKEDVRIIFSVAGALPTQLHLRGLTGTSTVTKLK